MLGYVSSGNQVKIVNRRAKPGKPLRALAARRRHMLREMHVALVKYVRRPPNARRRAATAAAVDCEKEASDFCDVPR